MRSSSDLTTEEWNEPVFYCRDCFSLKVLADESIATGEWDGSYCGHCGSSNIGQMPFGEWLAVEERRLEKASEVGWKK